jgi:crossover junction endodeoxyribonuclease RuvC
MELKKVYIGIDPGLTGAVAAIYQGGYQVWDAPTLETKTRRYPCVELMASLIESIRGEFDEAVAAVERAQSAPQQGIASTFNYGVGYGMWLGVLAASNVKTLKPRPQEWMAWVFSDHGTPNLDKKERSRRRAIQLFPEADLDLKRHHGRAEALLIAEWSRRVGWSMATSNRAVQVQ